jgi:hypothetical protein
MQPVTATSCTSSFGGRASAEAPKPPMAAKAAPATSFRIMGEFYNR